MDYKISEYFNGYSVLDFLNYVSLGKSKIHILFNDKLIYLNNKLAKRNDILKEDDILTINYNESVNLKPFKYDLDIIYEDDYLLIIDKPPFFLVHDDGNSHEDTISNMVAYYYLKNNINFIVRPCHRLDIETSGILVFAKDMLTESYFKNHFLLHDFKREYLAICSGKVLPDKGVIEANIGEDRHHNQRRRVSKTGQYAKTSYEVIKYFKHYSLVSLVLDTGRTHQIRVHMKYLGYPLIGDVLYGASNKYNDRVSLHSYRFTFNHMLTNKTITVCAKMPRDFKKLIE